MLVQIAHQSLMCWSLFPFSPFCPCRVSATLHKEQPTASCLFFAPDRFAHGSVQRCAAVARVGPSPRTHRTAPTGCRRDRSPRAEGGKMERARARLSNDTGRSITSFCHTRRELCIMSDDFECTVEGFTQKHCRRDLHRGHLYCEGG